MKGNPQKKMTFEDRFARHYECWVKNNPKSWRWWKKRNRKLFRKMLKKELTNLDKDDIMFT
jgi:hypothetical protein